MSASTGATCAVSEEGRDLGDSIDSVRCAVADVEQWLEGEDALSALVRKLALQLEAVRRTQLLQEQEIHGRNRELHELHDMLQALLSDGQAQSKRISELQARLDGHQQMFEGECAGTKGSGIAGSQLVVTSSEHPTQVVETLVQRLNLLEQRLACLEHAVAEYHETHKPAIRDWSNWRSSGTEDMQASRCMCHQSNWATDIRKRLESLADDVGRRLEDLDSGMGLHSKQLDSFQAAHTMLAEQLSERAPCYTEVMSHFTLFVKKEDACMQQAALDDRITRLERATVGSLQGASSNFHPGMTGTSTTARGRTMAADGITHAVGEQEMQKNRPETGECMEEDGNERWPGPEVQRTSTSVEMNHGSLAAGTMVFAQSTRPVEPVMCLTQQEWRPCSVLSPRCSVGATAAVRSLSSTAIERRGKAATVGPIITAHGVTPAVTSNYVLLQRSTVHAPPMPLTCRETPTALVIQSPSASPPLPTVADTLFSKIDANKDGVISRSEWKNALM